MSDLTYWSEHLWEAAKELEKSLLEDINADAQHTWIEEEYLNESISEPVDLTVDDLTADIYKAYEKATEKGYSSYWEEYYIFPGSSSADREQINEHKMRRARSYVDMFKDSNPKTLLNQLKTVMTFDEIREFLPETGIDVEIYEEWREVKERRKEVLDKVSKIYNIIPDISTHITDCPTSDCSKKSYPVAGIITHLNDKHDWSRNEIADWLETLPIDLTFPIPNKEVTHEHGNQDTPGQGAGPADDQDAA